MKATLDCLACVAAQAVRAARFASDDPQVQRRILDQTVAMIPGMDLDACPAVLSNPPYEIAARESGNPDPYATMRREQNAFALELEPELRAIIRDSADPIRAALGCSMTRKAPKAPPPMPSAGDLAPAPGEEGTLPSGLRVEIEGKTVRVFTSDPAEVQPVIDGLRAQQLVIEAVGQVRQSLEDYFIETVSDTRSDARQGGAA